LGRDDPTRTSRQGRLLGVLLLCASHLIFARTRAAMDELDQGAEFGEAHESRRGASAAKVPSKRIGRMLTPDEAARLLRSAFIGFHGTSSSGQQMCLFYGGR
jgi:hypothetical protein